VFVSIKRIHVRQASEYTDTAGSDNVLVLVALGSLFLVSRMCSWNSSFQ